MSEVLIPAKKEFLENWDTKWGLLYNIHIFLATGSILLLLFKLGVVSLDRARVIIFIPNFVFLIFWFIRRSYIDITFSKKLNIVFAIDLEGKNENTYKIYKETLDNLKTKIIENDLDRFVVVKEKPNDISFKNKTAAEAKTQMNLPGSVLLIWGTIINYKFKIFFSYEFGYPGKEEEYYKKIFSQRVDKILVEKLWQYRGPDSIELLSHDFLEASYFILGLAMDSLGRFDKAIILFKELLRKWKSSDLIKIKNLWSAIKEAEGVLSKIYLYYAEKYYNKEDYKNMAKYCNDILNLNFDNKCNYAACLFLAIYYEFVEENTDKAKEYNEKAFNIHPPRQEHYQFNNAYFLVGDYKFKEALEIYEKLSQWNHQTNYSHMRNLLFRKYEKTNNLGFLFVEAFIALIFQKDFNYGKKELKIFIKKVLNAKDGKDYSVLLDKARFLLGDE